MLTEAIQKHNVQNHQARGKGLEPSLNSQQARFPLLGLLSGLLLLSREYNRRGAHQ